LILQGGHAFVVDPHRPGPVTAGVVQPDQRSVGRLGQPVQGARSFGVPQSRLDLAVRLEHRHQLFERRRRPPAVLVAFGGQPLVVAALEQVTGVEIGRGPRVPGVERRVEGRDIGRRIVHGQGLRRRAQEAVRVRDRGPQRVQDVPQVGPGLPVGRVGPEQEGDPVPALRRARPQRQVGQQRLGAGRRQRDGDTVHPDLEGAEQPDVHQRSSTTGP
jgi:hypothetical protein